MFSPHPSARRLLFAGALVLGLIVGCGGGPRSAVAGKVTYAGEKVDQGGIVFLPAEEGSALLKATGQIHAGHYQFDRQSGPQPGKYRVEITWRKKTGNKVPGEGGHPRDELVPGIPAKFNTESQLFVDVKPGNNTFDFILTE